MRRLHVSRVVPVPLDVVWDVLVRVDRWPQWGPSIRAVELDTERIRLGSRGSVETVGGARLRFEITELTELSSWAWRVAGIDATDHVVESVPGGTRVTFGVPLVAAGYLAVCAVALRRIDRLVTS